MAFDVVTVGGATVDVFIETAEKELKKDISHRDVCYMVGEKILVPSMKVDTGGGGTNTAVAFSKLGLKTGFIGKIGKDMIGKNILSVLGKEKVKFLGSTGNGESGYSVILMHLPKDRTILTFKGINDQLSTRDVKWSGLKAKWIYFSSLMGQSFATSKKIVSYAKKHKIRWAFNPSMYMAEKGLTYLKPMINGCDVLIMNKEEAQALLKSSIDIPALLKKLAKYAKIPIITDGPKGAYAYFDGVMYHNIPYNVKVVETTGAGDAFASGVVAGLMLKKDLEFALRLGQAESESKIQHLGAKNGLLSRNEAFRLMNKVKVIKKRI